MVHVPYFTISPWTSVLPISPWTSGSADRQRKDECRALWPRAVAPPMDGGRRVRARREERAGAFLAAVAVLFRDEMVACEIVMLTG